MFQKLHVFDLDGTTIDSFHRVEPCIKPDGDLDLQAYRETACTHDKVQADTLLPLAKYMQDLIKKGEKVAICTARKMSKTDYVYLRKAGMRVNTICSRDQLFKHFDPVQAKAIYHMKDADYKRFWLQRLQILFPLHSLVIYDDHQGVLAMAKEIGVIAFDAREVNQILDAGFKMGYETASDDYENEIEHLLGAIA